MENAQKNPQAMQEALLETLNRLARINEVEGFDPRLLVACYKNESGEEKVNRQSQFVAGGLLYIRRKRKCVTRRSLVSRSMMC